MPAWLGACLAGGRPKVRAGPTLHVLQRVVVVEVVLQNGICRSSSTPAGLALARDPNPEAR